VSLCGYHRFWIENIPNEDISLLFDHHEVSARILMFSHECMRDKVQEHIRQEPPGLWSW
jgi:hypothetical protein